MAKAEGLDNGLGLDSFVSDPSKPEGESTPSPAAEPKAEAPKEEAKSEAKTEAKAEDKTEPVTEEKKDPKPEKKEDVAKPKEEVQKPSFDWESDSNPYKQRYANTSYWTNQVNQKNSEVMRQLEIMQQKLDGTYDPATQAPPPSVQQITQGAEIAGKIRASRALANEVYGAENVQKLILDEGSPFRAIENDPYIQARVLASDAPVIEAMKVLQEKAFQVKWGTYPSEIEANIRKKVEEELTQKITDEVTKKIMGNISLKEKQVNGIGQARSADGKFTAEDSIKSLSSIFS